MTVVGLILSVRLPKNYEVFCVFFSRFHGTIHDLAKLQKTHISKLAGGPTELFIV